MKKFFQITALVVGCAGSSLVSAQTVNYRNADNNFQVSIPKSWEVEEFRVGAAAARFSIKEGDFVANCTVTIVPEKRFTQTQKWLDEKVNSKPLTDEFAGKMASGLRAEGFTVANVYRKKIPVKPVSREALFYSANYHAEALGRQLYFQAVHLPYSMPGKQVDLSCRGAGTTRSASQGSFELFADDFLRFFETFKSLR